jgi:hypothetical protein
MAAENSTYTCTSGGQQIEIPVTATAWIDVSGTEAATCSDLQNQQCVPAPSDPQGQQSIVVHPGEMNWIHLDVVDPP